MVLFFSLGLFYAPNVPVFKVSKELMDPDNFSRRGPDDAECVRATLRGELKAFDNLIKRYQQQATGLAWRLLNNMDDAMEVVQASFLRAYEKLGSLSRPERFGSWLISHATQCAYSATRTIWWDTKMATVL